MGTFSYQRDATDNKSNYVMNASTGESSYARIVDGVNEGGGGSGGTKTYTAGVDWTGGSLSFDGMSYSSPNITFPYGSSLAGELEADYANIVGAQITFSFDDKGETITLTGTVTDAFEPGMAPRRLALQAVPPLTTYTQVYTINPIITVTYS